MDGSGVALSTVDEKTVLDAERQHIQDNWNDEARGKLNPSAMAGLALSGGGVRSASFSIGVMQALAEEEADAIPLGKKLSPSVLQRLQYLSTVSGGGFAGAALTRLLCESGSNYDLGKAFPFRRQTGTVANAQTLIDEIRHRASYLEPGSGLDRFSAIGVVLRTVTVNVFIYLLVTAALICAIYPWVMQPRIILTFVDVKPIRFC